MAESVYKIIELVGTSTESWQKAAAAAVKLDPVTLEVMNNRLAAIAEEMGIVLGQTQAAGQKTPP